MGHILQRASDRALAQPGFIFEQLEGRLLLSGTIKGTVYDDVNSNAKRDASEAALPGLTVTLVDGQTFNTTTATTGANGVYQFSNVPAGQYLLEMAEPPGTKRTAPENFSTVYTQVLDGQTVVTDIGTTKYVLLPSVDKTFGTGGKVVGPTDNAEDLIRQPDGKLLVFGRHGLYRFTANGGVDSSFGVNGQQPISIDGFQPSRAVQTSDGKFDVAGDVFKPGVYQTGVVRFNADGTVDKTFGSQGIAIADFTHLDFPTLTVRSDGRVILAGGLNSTIDVEQFLASGVRDPSFGAPSTPGRQSIALPVSQGVIAVITQADGKILLTDQGFLTGHLVRLTAAGLLDSTFTGGGISNFDNHQDTLEAADMVIDQYGRILVGARAGDGFAVLAFRANGTLDTDFASNGEAFNFFNSTLYQQSSPSIAIAKRIALDSEGNIIVMGVANTTSPEQMDFAAIRFNSSGGNDPLFGLEGATSAALSDYDDELAAGAVLPDGRVVCVGTINGSNPFSSSRIGLVQFLDDDLHVRVSGSVFIDSYRNSVQDIGEAGLPNVTVYVDYNKNGVLDQGDVVTKTDAAGNYLFPSLLAQVEFYIRAIVPPGLTPSYFESNLRLVDGIGGTVINIGFGMAYVAPVTTIAGLVYDDLNLDGVADISDPKISRQEVYLDANKNGKLDSGERTTQTLPGGDYLFQNIAPGAYRVASVTPAGWRLTQPAAGYYDVTVGSQQTVDGLDFGQTQTSLIAGLLFNDANANGTLEASEKGIAGRTVFIDTNKNGKFDAGEPSTTTASNGSFSFNNLAAGGYRIADVLPASWRRTAPSAGYYDITLAAGQAVTGKNFAQTQNVLITGSVFNDTNGNGKQDAGEKGIAGRTIYLDKNKNGKLDAGEPLTVTAADGTYSFKTQPAGSFRVREILPAGSRVTSPTIGYSDLTLAAGQSATGKSFADTTTAMIAGIVFRDANANTVKDSAESLLSGWVVFLDTNNNGKLDAGEKSFTTASGGAFSFVVPAGTYRLREVLKSGFTRTTPSTGLFTITLTTGQTATGKSFGNK